ncbi:MAG: MBL fold metallo-hydrolase, partial [Clostridia bacterium]|nr:MBL fold metallo-hydrolase [Clostridia bacterium]
MKIEYFGHACFKITEDRYSIVIDPYEKIRGFKDVNLSANEVICTHSHYDHAFKQGVRITLNLPYNPFEIEKID